MSDFLGMDGNIAFNMAIYNRFSSIGDSSYAEICGSFIEGVHQWADHNIYDVTESENAKYIGYTIAFNDNSGYGQVLRRVYIERWVMNIMPKDWKLFRFFSNVESTSKWRLHALILKLSKWLCLILFISVVGLIRRRRLLLWFSNS